MSSEYDTDSASTNSERYPTRHPKRQWPKRPHNKKKSKDNTGKNSLKVINLTDKVLTRPQLEVLGKGLTFSPSANFYFFLAVKDLHLFARKLIFKKLYHTRQHENLFPTEDEQETLRILESLLQEQTMEAEGKLPKSILPSSKKFPPISMYSNIEVFVKLVTAEFAKIDNRILGDNLTKEQRIALRQLKEMKEVIIKPSDKGGNVVLWSTQAYEREAFRQLRNTEYTQL